jgi:hypothetical protein
VFWGLRQAQASVIKMSKVDFNYESICPLLLGAEVFARSQDTRPPTKHIIKKLMREMIMLLYANTSDPVEVFLAPLFPRGLLSRSAQHARPFFPSQLSDYRALSQESYAVLFEQQLPSEKRKNYLLSRKSLCEDIDAFTHQQIDRSTRLNVPPFYSLRVSTSLPKGGRRDDFCGPRNS